MLISRRLFQNESEAPKAQPLHGSSRMCVRTFDTASRNGPTGETCATFDPQECAVRLPGPSERTQTSTQACGRPAAASRPVPDQKEPEPGCASASGQRSNLDHCAFSRCS